MTATGRSNTSHQAARSALESRPMKSTLHITARIGLALLAATVHAAARAEWHEIHRFDDGMLVFVNPQTAQRNGNLAEIDHLVRWPEPQEADDGTIYLSTIVHTRYDCAHKLERYLGSTSYAGPAANGDVVISDDDAAERWDTISAASLEEKLWTQACAAR